MTSKVFCVVRVNMVGSKINTTKNYAKVDLELRVAKTRYLEATTRTKNKACDSVGDE